MSDKKNVTDKFKNMIEAFECDFNLAVEGHYDLSDLDEVIKDKSNLRHEKMINDIGLLCELSFLLRNGKAEIYLTD